MNIGCRYEFEGPLPFQIDFIVTAPDSDGDGIPDDQDACPTVFYQGGNGCPPAVDTDGDGIPDNQDGCPTVFYQGGNGCPPAADTDGDGIPDNQDACPTVFYQGGNGCPPAPGVTPVINTPIPQPQVALPPLPGTGACVVATRTGDPVNVRAERSTSAAIVTRLDPRQIYTPSQFVDGWYFIASLNGWVRADVIRTGGANCQSLGSTPAATVTSAPSTGGLPPFVIPAVPDLSGAFGACSNLAAQAGRLPVGQLLRIIGTGDACGGLQAALRDAVFNVPRPQVPQPISDALSSTARCSSDSNPFPSPALLHIMGTLDAINPALAAQLSAGIAAASGSVPDSDGDRFLCALMRGDVFRAVLYGGTYFSPGADDLMYEFFGTVCVPPLEAASVPVRADSLVAAIAAAAAAPPSPFGINFPPSAAVLVALTDEASPLSNRQMTWCAMLANGVNASRQRLTPEQNAVIDWLIRCGTVSEADVPGLLRDLERGYIENNWIGRLGISWAGLLNLYATVGPDACPTSDRFLTALVEGELDVVQESSAEVIPLEVDYSIGGFVYEVICRAETGAVAPGTVAPPGCVLEEIVVPVPASARRSNPFGPPAPPRIGGGSAPAIETQVALQIVPNRNRDPFEGPIGGVHVQIGRGRCGAGGALVTTATTDASGFFFVSELETGDYCLRIAPENNEALGEGRWYTPIVNFTNSPIEMTVRAWPDGGIVPIVQFGWQRADDLNTINYSLVPALDVLLDLPMHSPVEDPSEIVGDDILPGGSVQEPIAQEIRLTVFDDTCDTSLFDGDPSRTPPGCIYLGGATLAPNAVQDPFEVGIGGVEVELLEGTCDRGRVVGVASTDGSGTLSINALLFSDTDYCVSVTANSPANIPVLSPGGWTTVSGLRITYRIGATTTSRTWNISFPWWYQAAAAAGVSNPFFEPPQPGPITEVGARPQLPVDELLIIPRDARTPVGNVEFLARVWQDVCDPSGWTGDFRDVPAGCALDEAGLLTSNGAYDDGERPLAGVTISILLGDCSGGSERFDFMTTDAEGNGRNALPLRPGRYCVLVDPLRGSNTTALGAGQWPSGLGYDARTEITIPYFRPNVTIMFPWQPAGSSIAEAPPLPSGPSAGLAPAIPTAADAVCSAGCTPRSLPAPRTSTPALGTVGTPDDTLSLVNTLLTESGVTLVDYRGDVPGVGVFVGRGGSGNPQLYLYDSGAVFALAVDETASVAGASLSPDGRQIAFVSRDAGDRGTVFVMSAASGFYVPVFSETDGTRLDDGAPLWTLDGTALVLVISDVGADGETPNVYTLDLSRPSTLPQLAVEDARDPAATADGELLAFSRDGNIFVQLAGDQTPLQLTAQPTGTRCEDPFFGEDGLSLYFVCRADTGEVSLLVQGFDGLQTVPVGLDGLRHAYPGPAVGMLTLEDGRSLFLSGLDGSNVRPLVQLSDLEVASMRWAR